MRDGLRHRQEERARRHRPPRALRRRLGNGPGGRSHRCPSCRPPAGFKVAIVGSGPAGLACAADLALRGHEVTIFEALHKPGGVLVYGIPEFRLPKKIVQDEIGNLEKLGVEIAMNFVVGKTASVEELISEYGFDAVFIGTGAGLPYFMGIPGENLIGVFSANEFLTRVNLMKAFDFPDFDTPVRLGDNVAVVGAGNVAMDCLRTAKRLGAENVICLYRRTRDESPAAARGDRPRRGGGHRLPLAGVAGGDLRQRRRPRHRRPGPEDGARRARRLRPPPPGAHRGRPVRHRARQLIIGIGQGPNPLVTQSTKGLELNRWGNIVVDEETMMTSIDGVFAGGDIVTGAATVILAMGAGKKASEGIDAYLRGKGHGKERLRSIDQSNHGPGRGTVPARAILRARSCMFRV